MGWFDKPKKSLIPPNDVFPAIDRDRIARDLDLATTGARNGRNDMPESDRSDFDVTENAVVGRIEETRREGLSRFSEQVSVYRERIARIETIGPGIREAAHKAEIDFRAAIAASRERLEDKRRDFNEVRDELKGFQERNKIGRTPHEYKGGPQWWAITFSILAIESALNGVFFAEAHVMGLVGGTAIALVISLINIVTAIIAGHWFRFVNHIHIVAKLFGLLALVIGILIAAFNFAVGHFRDAAIEVPLEQAPGVAFERLASGRYLMESLDAWLLALLGILIAVFAFWKAYTMTDPYPGYGRVGRKYAEKRQEWRDLQEETLEALKDTRDEATEELKQRRDDARSDIDNAVSAYGGLIALRSGRDSFLGDCDSAADHLLTVYRDANRQARETPSPAYFSKTFRFPPERELEPPSEPDGEAMKRFRETVDDAVERINGECHKAISSFENGDTVADGAS